MSKRFHNDGPVSSRELLNRLEEIMARAERRRRIRQFLQALRTVIAHLTLEGD